MDPSDVGSLGALALVLLLLGKEALSIIAKKSNDNGNATVIGALRTSDQRLENIQEELQRVRAGLSEVLLMYHNLELRIAVHERQALRTESELHILRAMVDRKI